MKCSKKDKVNKQTNKQTNKRERVDRVFSDTRNDCLRSIEEAGVAIKSPLCPLKPFLPSVATLDGDEEEEEESTGPQNIKLCVQ